MGVGAVPCGGAVGFSSVCVLGEGAHSGHMEPHPSEPTDRQTDRYDWKHYLPVTLLADGNKAVGKWKHRSTLFFVLAAGYIIHSITSYFTRKFIHHFTLVQTQVLVYTVVHKIVNPYRSANLNFLCWTYIYIYFYVFFKTVQLVGRHPNLSIA